jgi:hypothetical protein
MLPASPALLSKRSPVILLQMLPAVEGSLPLTSTALPSRYLGILPPDLRDLGLGFGSIAFRSSGNPSNEGYVVLWSSFGFLIVNSPSFHMVTLCPSFVV